MMKKFLMLLLSLCLVLSLAACGQPADAPADNPADTPASGQEDTPAPAVGVAKEDLKIGVFIGSTAQDGGWGTALYNSVQAFITSYGLSPDQVIWVENIYDGTEDVNNIIDQLVDEGCQVIIAHSAGYVDQVAEKAQQYPEVYFCGYECQPETDNALMYSISDYQTTFLCGYMAALMSQGDQLGYVATMPTTTICRLINGFAQGVKYAKPEAKVKVIFTNSWYDPSAEKEAAITLLEGGANVLGYGGSTSAAAQACTEYPGSYTTGNYIDMHDFGPSVVLVSHLIDWGNFLTDVADMVIAGTWSNENRLYGIADGSADVSALNTDIIPAEYQQSFQATYDMLFNGELEVFAGPLNDNQGNQLAGEGQVLTPTDLLIVNYLVDNVEGSL